VWFRGWDRSGGQLRSASEVGRAQSGVVSAMGGGGRSGVLKRHVRDAALGVTERALRFNVDHALAIHLVQTMVEQGVEAEPTRPTNQEDGEKED